MSIYRKSATLIKLHRTLRGLSQEELSRQSGLSVEYISALEEVKGDPTLEALQSIFDALGKTLTLEIEDDGEGIPAAERSGNLAQRIQGLLQAVDADILEDLSYAFAAVASKHPNPTGVFIESLASEALAASFERRVELGSSSPVRKTREVAPSSKP